MNTPHAKDIAIENYELVTSGEELLLTFDVIDLPEQLSTGLSFERLEWLLPDQPPPNPNPGPNPGPGFEPIGTHANPGGNAGGGNAGGDPGSDNIVSDNAGNNSPSSPITLKVRLHNAPISLYFLDVPPLQAARLQGKGRVAGGIDKLWVVALDSTQGSSANTMATNGLSRRRSPVPPKIQSAAILDVPGRLPLPALL